MSTTTLKREPSLPRFETDPASMKREEQPLRIEDADSTEVAQFLPYWNAILNFLRHRGMACALVAAFHVGLYVLLMTTSYGRRSVTEPAPLQVRMMELPAASQLPAPIPAVPIDPITVQTPQVVTPELTVNAPPSSNAITVSPSPPATTVPTNDAPPSPTVTPPNFNADYLSNPAPAYPPLSRRLHEEGEVILRVRVTTQGQAAEVQLERTSGFARLDSAAMGAVSRWRFVPARRGEEIVEAWVRVPIEFSLNKA